MPQSLARVIIHQVFSTKDRRRSILPVVRPAIHGCLAGLLRHNKCEPIQIGGVEDHVHLVYGLSRTVTIANLTSDIKSASTKWIRSTLPPVHNLGAFAWQGGYAVYSVSESCLADVVKYVRDQESRHQSQTFEQEYRRLLELHGITYDEAYVFD